MHAPRPGEGFYLDGEPHVDPSRFIEHYCATRGIAVADLGVQPIVVATFSDELTSYLAGACGAVPAPHARPRTATFATPEGVSIITLGVGAPVAVALAEELYVCGMRTLIVTGSAGSLQQHAPVGTIIVPVSAIREEGTSHHYVPHDAPAEASPPVVDAITGVLEERGTPYVRGVHWTTDAIYREHKTKVALYREAGVLTVDMELSALYTLAAYRGMACGAVLAVSDELHGDAWKIGFQEEATLRGMARAGRVALEAATRLARV